MFYEIREVPGLKKKPSTSELLDWLKLLVAEDLPPEALRAKGGDIIPPLYGALLKSEQDLHLFERLAFMHRREQRKGSDARAHRVEAYGYAFTYNGNCEVASMNAASKKPGRRRRPWLVAVAVLVIALVALYELRGCARPAAGRSRRPGTAGPWRRFAVACASCRRRAGGRARLASAQGRRAPAGSASRSSGHTWHHPDQPAVPADPVLPEGPGRQRLQATCRASPTA